ncbi:uncharacterized protein LOC110194017 [Phascolarctos cinereus]|uniref:Serine/threonine-protein phosphatase 1 regulatory subunit 10-like n=1 Tax=Phascolarctos cinereus TaxID=38626 RepID=A0A6P5IID8_PHACI|nr:serine/threonine-protein phosphatase 1 regulatory subunit 10-like [Phascolarctos cinereus]
MGALQLKFQGKDSTGQGLPKVGGGTVEPLPSPGPKVCHLHGRGAAGKQPPPPPPPPPGFRRRQWARASLLPRLPTVGGAPAAGTAARAELELGSGGRGGCEAREQPGRGLLWLAGWRMEEKVGAEGDCGAQGWGRSLLEENEQEEGADLPSSLRPPPSPPFARGGGAGVCRMKCIPPGQGLATRRAQARGAPAGQAAMVAPGQGPHPKSPGLSVPLCQAWNASRMS